MIKWILRILDIFNSSVQKNVEIKEQKRKIINIENPKIEFISADLICNINGRNNENFWNHHGHTRKDYIELAEKSKILYEMYIQGNTLELIKRDVNCKDLANIYLNDNTCISVYRYDDKYNLLGDGRHRVAAAQELNIFIPVMVTGEYI